MVARLSADGCLKRQGRGVYLLPGDKLNRDASIAWLAGQVTGLHVGGKTALAWRGVRHHIGMKEVLSLWGTGHTPIPTWFKNEFPCIEQVRRLEQLMAHLTRIKVARLADALATSLDLPWRDIAAKHSRRLGAVRAGSTSLAIGAPFKVRQGAESRWRSFQFRDLRAKAATDIGDLAHSQKLLAHKNREMTEHYVRSRQGERVKPLR